MCRNFCPGGGGGRGAGEGGRGVEGDCLIFVPFLCRSLSNYVDKVNIYICPTSFSEIIISCDYFKIIFPTLSSFNCHVFQKFTI